MIGALNRGASTGFGAREGPGRRFGGRLVAAAGANAGSKAGGDRRRLQRRWHPGKSPWQRLGGTVASTADSGGDGACRSAGVRSSRRRRRLGVSAVAAAVSDWSLLDPTSMQR